MKERLFVSAFGLLLVAVGFSEANDNSNDNEQKGDAFAGKLIFERDWVAYTPNEGLGPVYNATSCADCHHQGGPGGGGENSKNVQLLSILPQRKKNGQFDLSRQSIEKMFRQGKKIHPDLGNSNGTVLHRFSIAPEYASWREALIWGKADRSIPDRRNNELNSTPIHRRTRKVAATTQSGRLIRSTNFTLQISQRNTPSLFGTGLIESIPDDEIRKIAAEQERTKDGIEGKVANVRGKVGRFGWRGQKSSLKEFTIQACAVELGLSTLTQSEPPIPGTVKTAVNYDPSDSHDMTEQQVIDLVKFIQQLPAPKEKLPKSTGELEFVSKGRIVFERLQCATCHVKTVGDVDGVYSDFLMHDMGPDLADVSGVISTSDVIQSIGGYFGPGSSTGDGRQPFGITVGKDTFWQTPPLWGIAESGPYLHDGRAKTLQQAILWHGGEAEVSARKYKQLPSKYRKYLHRYLETLGAIERDVDQVKPD